MVLRWQIGTSLGEAFGAAASASSFLASAPRASICSSKDGRQYDRRGTRVLQPAQIVELAGQR